MSEKQIRLWLMLGFGAVAAYYIFENKSAASNLIQPIAPENLAPIQLPGLNPTNAPPLRGSFTS